jgi:thiamine-phosphate pyrophosphorylase
MPQRPLLYYVTDRAAFPGNEEKRRRHLLGKIAEAEAAGVDYIQLREKDLTARELEQLAREAMQIIRDCDKPITDHRPPTTALLINSRTDIALASNADGVHLPADDISPAEVRKLWKCGAGTPFDKLRAGDARELSPLAPQISVSCHSPEEVTQAAHDGASLALFAPIFEKKDAPRATPQGLEALKQACRANIPVLALGGITLQNAASCLAAGAAGIAAIRLFQENDIASIVRKLREL